MMKKELRRIYGQSRLSLSLDDYNYYSDKISNLFKNIDLGLFKSVLTYFPIVQKQEFDIRRIEQLLQTENIDIKLSWPKIQKDSHSFDAFQINPLYGFIENEYHIPEPFNGSYTEPESIDLILVPLIIFSRQGFRVGYGKGYYDRFLSRCRPNALKVGFSFFEPVDTIDDIHHFDVPLNYCITPTQVYEF